MTLYINTKDQKQISVALRDAQGKQVKSLSEENEFGSQVLLPLIIKLLRTYTPGVDSNLHTVQPEVGSLFVKLKAIEVETGPGSFTGLRVGVSVANALGFSLGIPVNGKKLEEAVIY